MKKALLVLLFVLSVVMGFCQSNGDYQTRENGNWNQASTWEVFNNGWQSLGSIDAGAFRNVLPSNASGAITINHYVTVTHSFQAVNQMTITSIGRLDIAANRTVRVIEDFNETPLFIAFGGILANSGTLDLQTQLSSTPCIIEGRLVSVASVLCSNPALLEFHDNSIYQHANRNGGNIPLATWSNNSLLYITGLSDFNASIPSNFNQAFGNVLWNTPSLNGSYTLYLFGELTTVNGNLRFLSTGTRNVCLDSGGPGNTLTIGGNLIMNGGLLTLSQNQTSPTTVTIGGDLVISGGSLTFGSANNNSFEMLLNGNFEKTGGSLARGSGTGPGTLRFVGGAKTFVSNGGIVGSVNYSVESTILDLGTSSLLGSGTFTLNSGSILYVRSLATGGAIQQGTTGGNIRTSGTRTYQAGSTIVYNGSAAQFMGNGHPAQPHTTISNANGVTLLNNVSFNGDLVLDGPLHTQQQTVTFGGAVPQFILGSNSIIFYDLIVNQTAASSVSFSTAVDVSNSLAVNSASTVNAGTNQLRLLSTETRTANVNSLPAGASITGSVIVQRFLPKAFARRQFHYLASPVIGTTLADWGTEGATVIPLGKAYRWNEPAQTWDQIFPGTTLTNGRGYIVDVATSAQVTTDVRGTLGQGNVNVSLTTQATSGSYIGTNLIGNPYPAAIDWDNIIVPAGVSNAVYLVDNFGNSGQGTGTQVDVSYVDGVGIPAGYSGAIAQGQSFFVFTTANTTLTFTEAAKITPTNTQFFRESEIPNVLRIMLNGDDVKDETVIRLRDGATDNFDQQFDAYKLAKEKSNIATMTSDNVKAVINALGTSECNKIIPLVTEAMQQGSYTLSFVGMESFDSFITISLMDLVEKTTIDIRKQQEYSFAVTGKNIGSISSRFQISIEGGSAPINNDIMAVGETICNDKTTASITLDTSEPGVEYIAEWNGAKISEPATGTGSMLQLTISTSDLMIGENSVTIKAQSGTCSTTALSAKPVITKMNPGEINIVQSGVVCGEGQATLVVSGAAEEGWYQWYDEYDSQNPIPDQNGSELTTPYLAKSKTYYVAAVSGQGCEGSRKPISATISYADEVSLTRDGTTLVSSAETGNQWFFNGELLTNETGNTLEAVQSGIYTVNVTTGGCNKRDSIEVTGVESEEGISIFPNPTANKVFIRLKTANNNASATLVNIQGVEMATKALVGTGSRKEAEFDIQTYASGIYNVRILDGGKIITKKIAKVK